jgi:hypothetical protein
VSKVTDVGESGVFKGGNVGYVLHAERVVEGGATKKAGDLKPGVFFGFLAVVLVALIGAIVLYAVDKDTAAQVILPVGTGLLGLLTGRFLGEQASKA